MFKFFYSVKEKEPCLGLLLIGIVPPVYYYYDRRKQQQVQAEPSYCYVVTELPQNYLKHFTAQPVQDACNQHCFCFFSVHNLFLLNVIVDYSINRTVVRASKKYNPRFKCHQTAAYTLLLRSLSGVYPFSITEAEKITKNKKAVFRAHGNPIFSFTRCAPSGTIRRLPSSKVPLLPPKTDFFSLQSPAESPEILLQQSYT